MQTPHAHVVGSMLRPQELLDARERCQRGDIPANEFRGIEDRAVDRAIEVQEAAGIDVITDGEQRRTDFMESLLAAVSGVREIEVVGASVADDSFWHRDDPDYQPKVWVPPVVADKIAHLADLGCRHIQLDAPELTFLVGDAMAFSAFEAAGFTRESFLDTEVDILNGVASAPGVTFGVHLCRGNKENEWHSAGGYENISKGLFPRLESFDYLLLEFDDERSGGFEPLDDVPDDTCVVLGLVSTKHAEVEDHDALLRRIDEASQHHPREQLAISPQCGFASISYGNPIGETAEREKLELVGRIGREAWN